MFEEARSRAVAEVVVQDLPFSAVGERAFWKLRFDITAVLNCGEPESDASPGGSDAYYQVLILNVPARWVRAIDHLVTTKILVTDAQ